MHKRMLFCITIIVALCSIIYELLFSQVLTIVYGGTVVRYSMVIGLYLFSMGLGSFFFAKIKEHRLVKGFFLIEILLSLSGILGVFAIFYLQTLGLPETFTLWLSHLPVIVVGILTGLELPFLSRIVEKDNSAFSHVLGFDYFGSLLGTIVYALYLYPQLGLITTVLIIGLLNVLVALFFVIMQRGMLKQLLVGVGFALLILSFIVMHERVEDRVLDPYVEVHVHDSYMEFNPEATNISVQDHFTTPYQQIITYDVTLPIRNGSIRDRCLMMDKHVQLCDSWVEGYHHGLVDVPVAFFNRSLNVLVVGGGDFVIVKHLQAYNATIDLVDIDPTFMQYAKESSFLQEHHEDAYQYEHLTVHEGDAFYYIQETEEIYDLILLDLPGLKHDKLLPLYSTEFFSWMRSRLSADGLFVMWTYPLPEDEPYVQLYKGTLAEAGFTHTVEYWSYNLHYDEAKIDYFVVAGNTPRSFQSSTPYLEALPERYNNLTWKPLSLGEYNSVFAPRQDMIVP